MFSNTEPTVTFRDDILRLHILYLEKLGHLSKDEREAYTQYLIELSKPVFVEYNSNVEIQNV